MIDWISVEDRLPEDGKAKILVLTVASQVSVCFWENRRVKTSEEITHWYPYNPPVKRRWMPKNHEEYYFIRSDGEIQFAGWESIIKDDLWRAFMGAYSTREEAEVMRDKIREFVSSQTGEV